MTEERLGHTQLQGMDANFTEGYKERTKNMMKYRKCDILTPPISGMLANGLNPYMVDRSSVTKSAFYASRASKSISGGVNRFLPFALVQNGNNATEGHVDDDFEDMMNSVPDLLNPVKKEEGEKIESKKTENKTDEFYMVELPSESWGGVAIASITPGFGRLEGGTPIEIEARLPLLEERISPVSDLTCNFGGLYRTPIEVQTPLFENGTSLAIMNKGVGSSELYLSVEPNWLNLGVMDSPSKGGILAPDAVYPDKNHTLFETVMKAEAQTIILISEGIAEAEDLGSLYRRARYRSHAEDGSPKAGAYYLYDKKSRMYLHVVENYAKNETFNLSAWNETYQTETCENVYTGEPDPYYQGSLIQRNTRDVLLHAHGINQPDDDFETKAATNNEQQEFRVPGDDLRRRLVEERDSIAEKLQESGSVSEAERRRLIEHYVPPPTPEQPRCAEVYHIDPMHTPGLGIRRDGFKLMPIDWDNHLRPQLKEHNHNKVHHDRKSDMLFEFRNIEASKLPSEGSLMSLYHLQTGTYMMISYDMNVLTNKDIGLSDRSYMDDRTPYDVGGNDQYENNSFDFARPATIVPVQIQTDRYNNRLQDFPFNSSFAFNLKVYETKFPYYSKLKCSSPAHNKEEVLPITISTGAQEERDQAVMDEMKAEAQKAVHDVMNVGKSLFEYMPNFYISDFRPKKMFDVAHLDSTLMPERYVIFDIAYLNIPGERSLGRVFTRFPIYCTVNGDIVKGSWETKSSVKCPVKRSLPTLKRERFFSEPVKQIMTPAVPEMTQDPYLWYNKTQYGMFAAASRHHKEYIRYLETNQLEYLQDYMNEFFVLEPDRANHQFSVGFSLNGPNGDFIFPEVPISQRFIESTDKLPGGGAIGKAPASTAEELSSAVARDELYYPRYIPEQAMQPAVIPVLNFAIPYFGTPLTLSRDGGRITIVGLDWNDVLVEHFEAGEFKLFLVYEFSQVHNDLDNEEHLCFRQSTTSAKCNRPFMFHPTINDKDVEIPLSAKVILYDMEYRFKLAFGVKFADVAQVTRVQPQAIPLIRNSTEAMQPVVGEVDYNSHVKLIGGIFDLFVEYLCVWFDVHGRQFSVVKVVEMEETYVKCKVPNADVPTDMKATVHVIAADQLYGQQSDVNADGTSINPNVTDFVPLNLRDVGEDLGGLALGGAAVAIYSGPVISKMYPSTCGIGFKLRFEGLYFDRIPDKTSIDCVFSDTGSVSGTAYLRQSHQQIKTKFLVEKVAATNPRTLLGKQSRTTSIASCECPPYSDLAGRKTLTRC